MHTFIFAFVIFIITTLQLSAQEKELFDLKSDTLISSEYDYKTDSIIPDYVFDLHKHSIQFEYKGTGFKYSLFFEFLKKYNPLEYTALRIGLANVSDFYNTEIIIPITFTIINRFSPLSSFEYGLGVALNFIYLNPVEQRILLLGPLAHYSAIFSYRFQNKAGYMFSVKFTPLFQLRGGLMAWGGISIGKAF